LVGFAQKNGERVLIAFAGGCARISREQCSRILNGGPDFSSDPVKQFFAVVAELADAPA